MKQIIRVSIFIVFIGGIFFSCEDESKNRIPDINELTGAVTLLKQSTDPNNLFFNALNPLTSEMVEFEIDVNGFDVTEITSVDIEVVWTEKDGATDAEGKLIPLVRDAVIVKTITSFPSMVQISASDVADAYGLSGANDFEVGDAFRSTYPINTADGRRLTTAVNSDLCQQPAQPSFGGCNFDWAVACPSEIPAITYTAVSGGESTDGCPPVNPVVGNAYEVTLTALGGGQYTMSDFSAGIYQEWYGACYGYTFETTGTLTDVCNTISLAATDAFGCAAIGAGTYDPDTGVITITWSNCFGDKGDWVLTPK